MNSAVETNDLDNVDNISVGKLVLGDENDCIDDNHISISEDIVIASSLEQLEQPLVLPPKQPTVFERLYSLAKKPPNTTTSRRNPLSSVSSNSRVMAYNTSKVPPHGQQSSEKRVNTCVSVGSPTKLTHANVPGSPTRHVPATLTNAIHSTKPLTIPEEFHFSSESRVRRKAKTVATNSSQLNDNRFFRAASPAKRRRKSEIGVETPRKRNRKLNATASFLLSTSQLSPFKGIRKVPKNNTLKTDGEHKITKPVPFKLASGLRSQIHRKLVVTDSSGNKQAVHITKPHIHTQPKSPLLSTAVRASRTCRSDASSMNPKYTAPVIMSSSKPLTAPMTPKLSTASRCRR